MLYLIYLLVTLIGISQNHKTMSKLHNSTNLPANIFQKDNFYSLLYYLVRIYPVDSRYNYCLHDISLLAY